MAARDKKQVAQRWYLGGIASAGAACGTHPLDLLKVSNHAMCTIPCLTTGAPTNTTSGPERLLPNDNSCFEE